VVSFLTESTAAAPDLAVESTLVAESALVESTLVESALAVESVVEAEPEPLQAAKETAIANAKKPNLNEFFIL